ncbi:tyrosine-type recombinase/integrase [Blastococcus xanthinilyticus]|uniref:Site-specific recombinase XerD n=1 Tax=Blastococcus xanthinilyticus TaxID=1564164 RepID=A0A5S5CVF3_9ACTN|nr:tyrosine-type recombinase/integrase [Blastococcus xanthinilyticus]TYP86958.1 site-specific recombinase XerD [Blastococcus xanthinilyticus]
MTNVEEQGGTTPGRRKAPETRKRASGESSIYQDEDGRWHGFVSMGKKENGRRDRRHVSGARRVDVVAKVRAIEAKRDAGFVEAAGRALLVAEWLNHWLDNIAARKVRARTLESYRSTVRLHLTPGIGHHRLDRLQPEHLERLYAALADKGLSPASILRGHRVLSRALKVASQRGKVGRNVATLVDPPTVKRPQTALPLSADEARRVMAAAGAHRNAARWTVALAVGLRQSEALGLCWADVNLDEGTLTVRRGIHRVAGQGLVYEEPKAERSRRTLALPNQLVEALRTHRSAQLEERITAGSLWEDDDLVFAQANGRPIERKSDWQAWKALLHEAGVRDVRLHDGRHTAATLLLSEGVHPRVVMEVLGHAQMRTTTDTYSHVLPALGRDAADRMGNALWGPPAP